MPAVCVLFYSKRQETWTIFLILPCSQQVNKGWKFPWIKVQSLALRPRVQGSLCPQQLSQGKESSTTHPDTTLHPITPYGYPLWEEGHHTRILETLEGGPFTPRLCLPATPERETVAAIGMVSVYWLCPFSLKSGISGMVGVVPPVQ